MKKLILVVSLCLLTLAKSVAQNNDEKTAAFHLSFIPPLSTNGSRAAEYTNNVSFHLLAGISNNEKYFTFGGLANVILNYAGGFQFAGLYNYAGAGSGVLFGGLANTIKHNYRGMMFAGLVNMAADVEGFQFAGLVNIAKKVRGVQLGALLNIADYSDYPIGLVNIIKNGEMSVGLSYDETGSVLASFRSGGRIMYGILGFGYNHKAHDDSHYVTEGGFGAHIPIAERFRMNLELKGQFINDFSDSDDFVSKTSFSILPAFKITPNLELFAGPSLNYINTKDVRNKKMFPGSDLWRKFKDNRLQQIHVGYTAGIHWIF